MSYEISKLRQEVAEILKQWTGLAGCKILQQFPSQPRSLPTANPLVIVGLESLDLAPAGFGGFLGQDSHSVYNGLWATVSLSLDCYTDQQESLSCYHIFEQVCQCLVESDLNVEKIWCKNTDYLKSSFAYRLQAGAQLTVPLSIIKPLHPVNDFILKRGDVYH